MSKSGSVTTRPRKSLPWMKPAIVLDAVAEDRVAGIHVFHDESDQDLLLREVQVEGDHPGAGHHHLPDTGVGEIEDVLDVAHARSRAEDAGLVPLRHDVLHLLAGDEGLPFPR